LSSTDACDCAAGPLANTSRKLAAEKERATAVAAAKRRRAAPRGRGKHSARQGSVRGGSVFAKVMRFPHTSLLPSNRLWNKKCSERPENDIFEDPTHRKVALLDREGCFFCVSCIVPPKFETFLYVVFGQKVARAAPAKKYGVLGTSSDCLLFVARTMPILPPCAWRFGLVFDQKGQKRAKIPSIPVQNLRKPVQNAWTLQSALPRMIS